MRRGVKTAQLHVSAASHKADRSQRGMRIERCTDSSLISLKVGCDRLLILSEQHRIKLICGCRPCFVGIGASLQTIPLQNDMSPDVQESPNTYVW